MTVAPPRSIGRTEPSSVEIRNSWPVTDCTTIRNRPSGVTASPFALNPAAGLPSRANTSSSPAIVPSSSSAGTR